MKLATLIRSIYLCGLFDLQTSRLSSLSAQQKFCYILQKYANVFTGARSINFYGKKYHYDSVYGAMMLQYFFEEIERLDKVIHFKNINSLLDVGANIGQWTFVVKCRFNHIKAWSCEPMKEAFTCLSRNVSQFENWFAGNYAFGPHDGIHQMYYSCVSAAASFYKPMVEKRFHKEIYSTNVSVVRPDKYQAVYPLKYDLVKIDVEGSEMEVIESLRDVDSQWIYVEIHEGNTSEGVMKLLSSHNKKFTEVYRHVPLYSGITEVVYKKIP